ncbi:MAG TPA: STAS-like domain-containing protein [Synergistaceae bacterium]|nr:STAS-like domain-containing protein [Synergistaceae bacterium]HPQ38365.1 STAS-like domain-containing protein [Synergistaceae bacterium]
MKTSSNTKEVAAMSDHVKIKIADLIGSELCISAEDGQKVFGKLEPLVRAGKQVVISFENVTLLISLFLNVAIGQLYGSFSEDAIRGQLRVEGLSSDDMELLKRVVDNAKRYYANKESYDEAWLEEDGNEE